MSGNDGFAVKETEVVDMEVAVIDTKDITEITDLVMVVIMRNMVVT